MKLKSKTSKKKKIIIAIVIIGILAALGIGVWAIYRISQTQEQSSSDSHFQDVNPTTPKEENEQHSHAEQQKQSQAENNNETAPSAELDVHFTAVNQYEDTVQIRAEISELVNSGTCTLTLTKGDATITKTANTQASASISTCQGFDIPVSELSPGEWNIHLTVTNNNNKGHATTTLTVS